MSLAVLFGTGIFWLSVATPADLPATSRATSRMLRVAAPLAALSGLAGTLATIANIAGDPAGFLDGQVLDAFFFETPFGPVVAARLALLAVVAAVAFAPLPARARFVLVAAIAGLLLVSQAWLGHAAAGDDTPSGAAMIVAYACHVLAASAWIGGLVPLGLALGETGARSEAGWRLARRFSSVATIAVALVVAAGIANAAFRITALADLWTTPYGRVLLVKLGLAAGMLALAAGNRLIVATGRAVAWLRPSVAVELGAGLLVLLSAAVLGITPPPH